MPYIQPTTTRIGTVDGTPLYEPFNGAGQVNSVSAGPGITITGTASAPVVGMTTVINPTLVQSWVQNGLTATTPVGGALTEIPNSRQATAVGQKWLISGSTILNSTANNAAKVMTILVQFNSTVNFKYLVNIPESSALIGGKFNTFSLVIDVPTAGDTSFALYAYGGSAGSDGAITATVDMLTYTRLA